MAISFKWSWQFPQTLNLGGVIGSNEIQLGRFYEKAEEHELLLLQLVKIMRTRVYMNENKRRSAEPSLGELHIYLTVESEMVANIHSIICRRGNLNYK